MRLQELALDALTELFNLGVGQAADALSQIAGEAVVLTVPRARLLARGEQAPQWAARTAASRVCAVRQHYRGNVQTEAILIFSAEHSLQLVQMMVGADLPLDQLAEMEQEALSEIGNILLNAVMASVADALRIPLDGSLPTLEVSALGSVLRQSAAGSVLLVDIHFEVAAREIEGLLAFMLDVASEDELVRLLSVFVEQQA